MARRDARSDLFIFDGALNGIATKFIFDTGAFTVLLRAEDAVRAGIDVQALRYTITTSTPNGLTQVAPVVLGAVRGRQHREVERQGRVSRPGNSSVNLLGQSFLSRLGNYAADGDYMVLSED